MVLFDHPIWKRVAPYSHMVDGRDNLDFLRLPEQLRTLALAVEVNCVSCGRVIHPLRARAKSERSRVAGTLTEHRLFYAPTCETDVNTGCSRTKAAQAHKDAVKVIVKALCPVVGGSIEVYDALALKEPWLELILLGIKTLESRTKCLRKTSGDVVLVSSQDVDEGAWNDASVGGRLDAAAKERAIAGRGKFAGTVHMGGFRLGVPGVDDAPACIDIIAPDGRIRFVSPVSNPARVRCVDTVRVQERDGKILIVPGASQGFFRVPRSFVEVL